MCTRGEGHVKVWQRWGDMATSQGTPKTPAKPQGPRDTRDSPRTAPEGADPPAAGARTPLRSQRQWSLLLQPPACGPRDAGCGTLTQVLHGLGPAPGPVPTSLACASVNATCPPGAPRAGASTALRRATSAGEVAEGPGWLAGPGHSRVGLLRDGAFPALCCPSLLSWAVGAHPCPRPGPSAGRHTSVVPGWKGLSV